MLLQLIIGVFYMGFVWWWKKEDRPWPIVKCDMYLIMWVVTGMYEFPNTGQLLPILIGTTMQDPSGFELQVPILGAERDKLTGNICPLGGTMEDPEGQGQCQGQMGVICSIIVWSCWNKKWQIWGGGGLEWALSQKTKM